MSTQAYVDLMFAWGHARLGDADTARRLTAEAAERLRTRNDPIHNWLLDAFIFRIEEATAGSRHGGPWPENLRRGINELDARDFSQKSRQYVVDRLRHGSRILEPDDEINPYAPWMRFQRYGAPVFQLTKGPHEQRLERLREFCDQTDREADILDRLGAYRTLVANDEIIAGDLGSEITGRARRIAVDALGRGWANHPDVHSLFARHCPRPTDRNDKKAHAEYEADAANPGPRIEREVFGTAAWLHRTTLRVASRHGWRNVVASHADDVVRILVTPAPGAKCLGETHELAHALVRLGMRAEAKRLSDERRDLELAAYHRSGDEDQLVVCLAVAASDLWLGRAERADEALNLACRGQGGIGKPGAVFNVLHENLDALIHFEWPDRHSRLNVMVTALPVLPNGFTTAPWYSRVHVETADRLVLAVVLPKFAGNEEVQVPTTELANRREALVDLRAKLVEWVERCLDPHAAHPNRARPGHADQS